jgi:hypothetical protein
MAVYTLRVTVPLHGNRPPSFVKPLLALGHVLGIFQAGHLVTVAQHHFHFLDSGEMPVRETI